MQAFRPFKPLPLDNALRGPSTMNRRLAAVGLAVAICFSLPLSAAETTYQYDARGRLISVKQGTEKEANYVYDDAGNRLQANAGHPPGAPGVPQYGDASIWASNTVSWSAAAKNKAESVVYRLQKSLNGGAWTNVGDMTSATSVDVILDTDGFYQFRVKACNGARLKACSGYATSSMKLELRLQPDPPILNNPDGDPTVTMPSSVLFSWVNGGGTVNFYQMQTTQVEDYWSGYEDLGDSTTKMINFDVEHGYSYGHYWFRITACNVSWSCNVSRVVKVTIAPPTPGVPTVGNDDDHDGVFTVSWNSTSGASSYQLYERTNGAWSSTPVTTSGTSLNLTRNDGSYAYRVRACASSACSMDSGISSEIAIVNKPDVPSSISYASRDTNGAYTISWGSASASGAVGVVYRLQESKNGGTWTSIGSLTTSTSMSVSGRGNGDYKYRVRACNSGSTGFCSSFRSSSTTLEVRYPPSTPTGMSVPFSVETGDSYYARWDASSGTVTAYVLQGNDNGSGWYNAYIGTSRSKLLSAGTAGDFRSHRVKACNDWACSGWSGTDTVKFTSSSDGGGCDPLVGCGGPNSTDPGEPVIMIEPVDDSAMTTHALQPDVHEESGITSVHDNMEAAQ